MSTKGKKSSSASSQPQAVPPRDLSAVMKSRFFVVPSFEIYGGKAGLFDLGPPMATFEQNILQAWRRHFIHAERMLEISCTNVTPYKVLKTSGHVDKFQDIMVLDPVTGEAHRADHLLEHFADKELASNPDMPAEMKAELLQLKIQAESMTEEQIQESIEKFKILSPAGNKLDKPHPFNLMFETKIGPTGKDPAFLRPEIAQGMFMNYKNCYDYCNGKLPIAAAQMGKAFRNEISPQGGLFRLREFTLAEIEHFYDPEETSHPRFANVANVKVRLLPREEQEKGNLTPIVMTIEEAHKGRKCPGETCNCSCHASSSSSSSSASSSSPCCSEGCSCTRPVIVNETLAYFLGRTQLFLESVGLKPEKIRFRQHLLKQMAHYARDCWDAEALTEEIEEEENEQPAGKKKDSKKEGKKDKNEKAESAPAATRTEEWTEIVGIADRSCYDLRVHSAVSGKPLIAQRKLKEPKTVINAVPNKQVIGKELKQKGKAVMEYIEKMSEEEVLAMRKALHMEDTEKADTEKAEEAPFVIIKPFPDAPNEEVKITPQLVSFKKSVVHVENFLPYVIEPSFGISRIISAIISQNFSTRPTDSQRAVISFPPKVAPYAAVVYALQSDEKLRAKAAAVEDSLDVPLFTDPSTVSIGKRYARADEVGVAFAVTVDYTTLEDNTVTIRERDSMQQCRVPSAELPHLISSLINGTETWSKLTSKYPLVEVKEDEDD
ncbi:putative glycyl-tRNA synthetase [Monocercomonoides exilis]|uniref:putative glycyl-tRNA synthetase n=1 Tax=Monocercomonoides exilis TaxID=2049356 RepID=UPI003559C5D6|nr:putative glycyl-tRNA synthetase [Monocercomonoides exilis]|eukprot:MONOS_12282.1-p1 / transcript=MONOS_12282.1 / gene=MONOS_12282 / organism=Monocercomonoides_exilis_PA203 / gene_product=glycyl-tRNA synthetase / transcript_product=glycyl-tRNA synthetase / location=Mono_scaffold00670:17153-19440(-) / protein_length=719 / sequence_SO=supercontig / SO=protein_coding / is_pseudo=false